MASERQIKAHARRELIDGRLVAPNVEHATVNAYVNHGCRCFECTAVWREASGNWRQRRLDSRELIDGRLVATKASTHGTPSVYTAWGCKCEPCTDAWTAYQRERRAAKHGT